MSIKPGDVVRLSDCIRTVIALLPDHKILTDVGEIRKVDEVAILPDLNTMIIVLSEPAVKCLNLFNLAAPAFEDLSVGDGLLLVSGIKATITVVAVIDSPHKMAFAADGELLVSGDTNVYRNGWHTEQKNLLTEQGYLILSTLY